MISKEYIGLWGIALSAIFGVLGYLYKVWTDRIKSQKLVLFHLLEIHYVLKILPHSMSGLGSQYLSHYEKLIQQSGICIDGESKEKLQAFLPSIQNYFDELFSAVPKHLDEQFKKSFESSLQELAKDNPVLAYKLKGRQCLEMAGHAVQAYTTQLKPFPEDPHNVGVGDVVKEEIDKSIEMAYAEILDEINKDITRVALGCGLITYLKCRKVLRRKIEVGSDFSEFGLDQHIDSFMAKIIDAVKKEKVKNAC